MTIGERIKEVREKRGMTQEELAVACGYKSRSTINKLQVFFIFFTLFLQEHCIPDAGCRRCVANKKRMAVRNMVKRKEENQNP